MAGSDLPSGGASSHGEHLHLSQVLLLDTLSMGSEISRQVELRRVINAAVGSQPEDPSLGAVPAKALASLGAEELKRVRSFVGENSLKASERVKFLNEAILKLDKFRVPLSSRKRSRTEISTSATLSVDCSAVLLLDTLSMAEHLPLSQVLLLDTLSMAEHLPLSQVLLLDTLSMADQKFTGQVELRRVINAAVGSQPEDPALGAVPAKALASLGAEELKRVRSFVGENSLKARERVKFLNEAILKLDKFRVPLSSRKRPRTEI